MVEEFHVLQALGRTAFTLVVLVSKRESLQNPSTERLVFRANNCMLPLRKSIRAQWVYLTARFSRISQRVLLVTSNIAFIILQGC